MLTDPAQLRGVLRDATRVVCCAHARHAAAVIDAAPSEARLIFLGSTRKFTHWPDGHGNGVLAGEAAFTTSGRGGVMLHPTMIYGAQGEDNVQRLAHCCDVCQSFRCRMVGGRWCSRYTRMT